MVSFLAKQTNIPYFGLTSGGRIVTAGAILAYLLWGGYRKKRIPIL
ncbi:hypothetical protein MMU07_09855 [Aquiflexum sp. LQ15W]|nr:hypothetical protein [Cognataquiflexum nitidum]MCH6199886.1 hypothetical protein [Cognataquiflexum nitidum]